MGGYAYFLEQHSLKILFDNKKLAFVCLFVSVLESQTVCCSKVLILADWCGNRKKYHSLLV